MNFDIIRFVTTFFNLIYWTILIRIILSWIPSIRSSEGYFHLVQITEFIMTPVRKVLNAIGLNGGMIDWAPFLTIILLRFLQSFTLSLLLVK